MNLEIYNDKECILAAKKLSEYVKTKETFALQNSNIGMGLSITGDLSKKNYRQSYYKDCIFDSTICNSTGFSGSKFVNTVFRNCNLENSNLHSCDFNGLTFLGDQDSFLKVKNAGFHKSTFTNCIFQNLYLFSCGFTDVIFYNTTFRDCKIKLCSLENAQFKNCHFINTDMSALNLEYTEFDGIFAIKTTFPFATIPVAYGLLQQLSSLSSDNIIYTTANNENKLSISEYLHLLDDFERFYYKKKNYYGLANIYISQKRIEEGYIAIETGILNAIKIKDFRVLKHFCNLVYLSDIFTIQQRRNLYENISSWVSNESLTLSEYHNYLLFTGPIRQILLNGDYHRPTLYFYLKTNIESNELHKQAVLLKVIDQILTTCDVSQTSIELRHNSPFTDFLTVVCNNLTQFSQVLIMIYGSLAGINIFALGIKKIIESTQNIISNYDDHKIRKLEQKKLELELDIMTYEKEYRKKKEDVEYQKSITELRKLNLELENLENKSNEYQKILLENGIEVNIQHTSKNLRTAPMHEMIHYNQ